MEHQPAPLSSVERFAIAYPVPEGARAVGLVAGAVVAAASLAWHAWGFAVLGLILAVGALRVRAETTTVERGTLVQRFDRAPLRRGDVAVIAADRIRGVEVIDEYDSDAAPGRDHTYRVAVRLTDRRRRVAVGRGHHDRSEAETEAAHLRAALGRPAAGPQTVR
jgi:hypothetical protein